MTHTLMTVHAHPDDETIGTGGTMAKAVRAGHRVVLVTCTRGEMGEIVVKDMDTPENHRRLGEIRAGELEAAMGVLGVTEWENLGYRDSDMMGRDGQQRPADVLAGRPRRGRPAPDLADPPLQARRRHDVQRVRRLRPPRPHPGPRHRDPGRCREPATPTGTRSSSRRGRVEPWTPKKFYEQATPESIRRKMNERLAELGTDTAWLPPKDATPEQLAEYEERMSQMLTPDDQITTWIDIGDELEAKWAAIQKHVTQINMDFPFMKLGFDGWREFWGRETFVLRESMVETAKPESDVFAGLTDAATAVVAAGRRGKADRRSAPGSEPERTARTHRRPGATAVHQGSSPFEAS